MQVFCGKWWLLTLSLGLCVTAAAQTAAKPAPKSVPSKKHCQRNDGFCFKYPAGWDTLGEVFGGNGVVVAPPQKQEREFWDEVTVALVMPPPQSAAEAVTVDQLIDRAVSSVRETGQSVETLERQRRRVDGKPAQMVKLQYVEKASGREWIEELVFVEGPDAEIYSVALKCAPSSLARMEPMFSHIVDSWTLPDVEPPSDAAAVPESPSASPKPKAGTPPNQ